MKVEFELYVGTKFTVPYEETKHKDLVQKVLDNEVSKEGIAFDEVAFGSHIKWSELKSINLILD